MIGRMTAIGAVAILLAFTISAIRAQPAGTGVTASALGSANLRAAAAINAPIVGEIQSGASYPVIGRSEFYPWLLLGDRDSALPKGWVYETLVAVNGNVLRVPLSVLEVGQAPPTSVPALGSTSVASAALSTATPAPPSFALSGTVRGEVNIRHGPGVDYPRAGVAFRGRYFRNPPAITRSFPGCASSIPPAPMGRLGSRATCWTSAATYSALRPYRKSDSTCRPPPPRHPRCA